MVVLIEKDYRYNQAIVEQILSSYEGHIRIERETAGFIELGCSQRYGKYLIETLESLDDDQKMIYAIT